MITHIHLCARLFVLGAFTFSFSNTAFAEHNEDINLDEVVVTEPIDSRIAKHPATVETYSKLQIQDSINTTTAQQTLKYLPSFQVRERYIGDRNTYRY